MYNLTVYEQANPNEADRFSWVATEGRRGSNEIGTVILKWIGTLAEDAIEISLFSDSCPRQNRNQFLAVLLLHNVETIPQLETFTHTLLEPGHV